MTSAFDLNLATEKVSIVIVHQQTEAGRRALKLNMPTRVPASKILLIALGHTMNTQCMQISQENESRNDKQHTR